MAQKGIIKNSLTADVGAPELASCFGALIGASGILEVYSYLACTRINDNTIRLAAGVYNLSGYLLEVAKGTTVDLTIDSGTAGQNRNDIVAAEFVRNGGGAGIDTLHFVIVKGTSTAGTAADPALTQDDINGSGVTRQEALFRVKLAGTTLTTVEAVAGILTNLNSITPVSDVFTPTIYGATSAGTPTYSIRAGSYYRIGNLVHCDILIRLTDWGTMLGQWKIKNLPFTAKLSSVPKYPCVTFGQITGVTYPAGYNVLQGIITPNTSEITLLFSGSNVETANMTDSCGGSSTLDLTMSVTYEV